MRTAFTALLCVTMALAAPGCATTTFNSTWKAPDARPVGELIGKKVVGFVLTKNASSRRAAEDVLAAELSRGGAQGVAGYTLIADINVDEATAKATLSKAGAVGVVVLRPVAKDKAISSSPSMWMGAPYGGYWGGYYGYGWGAPWGGVDIRTDTIITVETLVYSLSQNKLIWAGMSETTNPSKIDAFVKEIVASAAKKMKKDGII
jgi:hypothetical protein